MRVTTSQYEILGAKITFAQWKRSPPEHNLPVREKTFVGTSSILAWVKVVCCLHYGFPFACNKYPPQFTDYKSNDSSMREGIPLDALNWFGRGYELHTPKSVGREGSKAWALSVVPHFSLSPPRLAFLAWGDFHARSRFARSTIYYFLTCRTTPWPETCDNLCLLFESGNLLLPCIVLF